MASIVTERVTIMGMASHTAHDPAEGVLCWGGPQHENVVPIRPTDDVVRFPVERRLSWRSYNPEAVESPSLSVQTVRYTVHRFGTKYANGDTEEWRVLIYGDGEERLLKNFEGTTRLFFWWSDPWGWT